MSLIRNAIILGLIVFAAYCTNPAWGVSIARNGDAAAVIVVHPDEAPPVKHAAAELQHFLHEITGADIVIQDQFRRGVSNLAVGPMAAKLLDPDFSTDDLGTDGLIVQSKAANLILAGDHPRGTLYAVYTLLEDVIGCRWWSSTVSTIPKKPTLTFDNLNIRCTPPLEYREVYWTDAFDGDWSVRNRCNGHGHRLDEKRGRRNIYEGFVHTFFPLIPPAKYFQTHPEWFSEINGKRRHEHAQLCLTNEEMRAELIKNLKVRLRNNPAATIASVSQNDWYGFCTCPECAAVDAEEGSHAGTLLRFVNAVAAEIEPEFPHVAVSTLAYQYTRKPPKFVRPRQNVIVRLCSIECSFSKPLADERNKSFRDDIIGWSKISNRLYIWDYTTNFQHYFRPHPNLRVLGPNVRFFADHGVKGIFEQGAYTSLGAEMAELRAWVLAKLLWNPKADDEALIREFLDGYYGPAAPHVARYLDAIHDSIDATGYYLGCLPPRNEPQPSFLTAAALTEGWRHLQLAERAVAADPAILERVKIAQLPALYAFLMHWTPLRGQARAAQLDWPMGDSPEAVRDAFMSVAKRNNVTRLREWDDGFVLLEDALKRARQ